MGFRFRRRLKIAPGVHVNLSKSGVSTSLGARGASVTLGKKGARANVGVPGTGLSYSEQLSSKKGSNGRDNDAEAKGSGIGFFKLLGLGLVGLMIFLVLFG